MLVLSLAKIIDDIPKNVHKQKIPCAGNRF